MGILSFLFRGNQINNLDAETFEQKIQTDENAVIVDVRTNEEYIQTRIPNSILIDIYSHEFLSKIDKLDRMKTYYIYCRSGGRSFSAANEMQKMGFQNVYNLKGGILSWGGQIERG